MSWLSNLFTTTLEPTSEEAAPPTPSATTPSLTETKVDFHIQRFTLACAQCTNPARLPELRANLDYWLAIRAAQDLKPE